MLLLICLFPCQLALLVEGIQTELLHSRSSLYLYLSHIAGAITVFMSLMVYDRLETINKYKPLVALLLYWFTSLCGSCLKIATLAFGGGGLSARLLFSLPMTTIYLVLLGLEVRLLYKLVSSNIYKSPLLYFYF